MDEKQLKNKYVKHKPQPNINIDVSLFVGYVRLNLIESTSFLLISIKKKIHLHLQEELC